MILGSKVSLCVHNLVSVSVLVCLPNFVGFLIPYILFQGSRSNDQLHALSESRTHKQLGCPIRHFPAVWL